MPEIPRQHQDRRDRLRQVIQALNEQGINQQQVASRAGLPSQFLSDLKSGRRVLGELVARRLGEEFGFDYQWLMTGGGTMSRSPLSNLQGAEKPGTSQATASLPVLARPTTGDPLTSPAWDGSMIAVAGPAAMKARQAAHPYILRWPVDDDTGRLRAGDLVLISQDIKAEGEVRVVRLGERLVLARRGKGGLWIPARKGKPLSASAAIVGTCIGIVWTPL